MNAPEFYPVVVLAGGESRRMGMPKGLVPIEGEHWLRRQITSLRQAGFFRFVVVLGHHVAAYRAAVPELQENFVVNPEPRRGQFSSLQCGVRAAGDSAVFILPIDTPCPGAVVWNALRARLQSGVLACVPEIFGRGGHPVLLSAALARTVADAPADARLDACLRECGAAAVRVPVEDERIRLNCNTREELAHAHRT